MDFWTLRTSGILYNNNYFLALFSLQAGPIYFASNWKKVRSYHCHDSAACNSNYCTCLGFFCLSFFSLFWWGKWLMSQNTFQRKKERDAKKMHFKCLESFFMNKTLILVIDMLLLSSYFWTTRSEILLPAQVRVTKVSFSYFHKAKCQKTKKGNYK